MPRRIRTCRHHSYGPANIDQVALVSRLLKVFFMKLPMKTAYHKAPYSPFHANASFPFLPVTHSHQSFITASALDLWSVRHCIAEA